MGNPRRKNHTRQWSLLLIWLLCATTAWGQRRVVVADAVSREPVERASLFTKDGGTFRAAISDEQGVAHVDFNFRRLTVSHLNYQQLQLTSLPDTIWLQTKYRQTPEVVVTNKEPAWIREKLRQVVKLKERNYFTRSDTMAMDYHTESLDQRSIYRYHMTGLLRMRDSENKRYAISPDTSSIVASDSTTLTDVANLRRMLYEDFVAELDRGFISGHRWAENPDYEGNSKNEIELVFRSKQRVDDRGRLVIDTARCVILQARRFTGTETNRHERMSAVLYAMSQVLTGYKVVKWTRDYHVSYGERPDGTFFPREVRYKTYMETQDNDTDQQQEEFHNQTGGGFPNMEATLYIADPNPSPLGRGELWEELPTSWYIRYSSDEARQQEVRLANLKSSFTIFE